MSTVQEQEPQLPLYRRIAQSIQQDIVQRSLVAHTKIPSEVELARQFGVSHGTITKALESLVRKGVLYRQRPQGTFVADTSGLLSSSPLTKTSGQRISTEQSSVHVQHVREQPIELTDVPHFLNQSRSSTAFVGIVIPHLGTDFLDGLVIGVEAMTRSFGYGLSFAYSEEDWGLERYHIEQFLRQGVAGMIIFPGEHSLELQGEHYVSSENGKERIVLLQTLQKNHIPFVLMDRYVPEIAASHVISDDFTAGYASTQHLIKLGHQRIGFISVNYILTSSAERYAGYLQCLRDYHLEVDEQLILRQMHHAYPQTKSPFSYMEPCCAEDLACLTVYLQHSQRPTAVVAMNEYIALQIMHATEHLAYTIPEDLALVCSGGSSSIGSLIRTPLTTVIQPVEEIGRQSVYILHNLICQRFSTIRQIKLPVSLLVRKSCGTLTDTIVHTLPHSGDRIF